VEECKHVLKEIRDWSEEIFNEGAVILYNDGLSGRSAERITIDLTCVAWFP
jgi:hypothetical protein